MSELRDVMARAMRAQGKADPAEVFAKVDAGEPDDPDPEWATVEEQDEQEPLFGGVACERCGDTREVPNHETDESVPCPVCVPLPEPARQQIGHFSDPAVSGAPDTQRRAAILQYPNSGTHRLKVLQLIAERRNHGATDDEIEHALGLRHQTASARRNELVKDGWIVKSQMERPTSSGDMAVVWVLTEAGRAQYRSVA